MPKIKNKIYGGVDVFLFDKYKDKDKDKDILQYDANNIDDIYISKIILFNYIMNKFDLFIIKFFKNDKDDNLYIKINKIIDEIKTTYKVYFLNNKNNIISIENIKKNFGNIRSKFSSKFKNKKYVGTTDINKIKYLIFPDFLDELNKKIFNGNTKTFPEILLDIIKELDQYSKEKQIKQNETIETPHETVAKTVENYTQNKDDPIILFKELLDSNNININKEINKEIKKEYIIDIYKISDKISDDLLKKTDTIDIIEKSNYFIKYYEGILNLFIENNFNNLIKEIIKLKNTPDIYNDNNKNYIDNVIDHFIEIIKFNIQKINIVLNIFTKYSIDNKDSKCSKIKIFEEKKVTLDKKIKNIENDLCANIIYNDISLIRQPFYKNISKFKNFNDIFIKIPNESLDLNNNTLNLTHGDVLRIINKIKETINFLSKKLELLNNNDKKGGRKKLSFKKIKNIKKSLS